MLIIAFHSVYFAIQQSERKNFSLKGTTFVYVLIDELLV
jgi:hypothetical protein